MKAADDNDVLAEEGIWNAFGLAIDDIVDNGRQGRSAINISVGCTPDDKKNAKEIKLQYKKLLRDAEDNGIVPYRVLVDHGYGGSTVEIPLIVQRPSKDRYNWDTVIEP